MEAKLGDVVNDIFPQCNHKLTEIRYKVTSNGNKQYATQCLTCGANTDGRWLPQKGLDIPSIKSWDDAIASEYQKKMATIRQGRLVQERIARHEEYERYIRESDHWQEIRTKVLRRDGHICRGCLENNATEIHYMNYRSLYAELMFDLVALCRDCHKKAHDIL